MNWDEPKQQIFLRFKIKLFAHGVIELPAIRFQEIQQTFHCD